MDGLVSIIIPVYNTPVDKLRRCIDSVLGQTMDRLEVILVDDGSGPQCASELDEAARKTVGYGSYIRGTKALPLPEIPE